MNKNIYEANKLHRSIVNVISPSYLAKVTDKVPKTWVTVLDFQGEKENTISDPVRFLLGIFEGDILLVILFTLSVNLLSDLLN